LLAVAVVVPVAQAEAQEVTAEGPQGVVIAALPTAEQTLAAAAVVEDTEEGRLALEVLEL
jgi:ATP-dependent 26S proteasome regulatory subunit